jgi:1-aminocyclopropane-1-carboxylate deaminase/D-cysteine desulfhydrase-like pyridoxal-dependent ACC family enzyme
VNLDRFPRIPLAHLPTALEPAPRLGAAIGLPKLWLKRDDCTGLAMGGNKARKLEYLLAEAVEQRADVLLTCGGVQSNHARMTAAAACKLGMASVLFLCDPQPAVEQGNLLLDRLFGAEVRFLPGAAISDSNAAMEAEAAELRARGRRPYIIPVGGSTPLGCLGYVRAVRELAEQARAQGLRLDAITITAGSTGTLAGTLLGARAFLPETRVYGISVSPRAEAGQRKCAGIIRDAAELRAQGRRPYISPVGGSTPLGCLGYVRAVRELAEQAREQGLRIDAITITAGSTGTLAGTLLGARAFLPETRVYGISVSPRAEAGQRKCAGIIRDAADLLGVDWRPEPAEVPVLDDWLGPAYGVPTPEGLEALRLAARLEGVLLDPVYTGKAVAGTRGLAARGDLRPHETVVFWHTGGAPALFAFNEILAESA